MGGLKGVILLGGPSTGMSVAIRMEADVQSHPHAASSVKTPVRAHGNSTCHPQVHMKAEGLYRSCRRFIHHVRERETRTTFRGST